MVFACADSLGTGPIGEKRFIPICLVISNQNTLMLPYAFVTLRVVTLHEIYPERRRDLPCSPSKTVVVFSCPQVDGFSSLFDKGEHGGKYIGISQGNSDVVGQSSRH